jgi:hypothetical protein
VRTRRFGYRVREAWLWTRSLTALVPLDGHWENVSLHDAALSERGYIPAAARTFAAVGPRGLGMVVVLSATAVVVATAVVLSAAAMVSAAAVMLAAAAVLLTRPVMMVVPAVKAFTAAITIAVVIAVAAPIIAGTTPAVVVPTIVVAAEQEATDDGAGNVERIELRELHLRNPRRGSADETCGDARMCGVSKRQRHAAQQRQHQD